MNQSSEAARGKRYDYTASLAGSDAASKLLGLVGRNRTVLEVGCASGSQTRVLANELGCDVTGVEIDPAAAASAARFCRKIVVGDFGALDLEAALDARRFDVVLFADVLEHLRDPLRALRSAAGLLREDGCVLASIPNVTHVALVIELACGRFEYRPFGLLDDTHVRFFDRRGVCQLFEEAGFSIVALDRVSRSPDATEFETDMTLPENRALFELIRRQNPEFETYQFIIKAARRGAEAPVDAGACTVYSRLDALEAELRAKSSRLASLEGKLGRIERNPAYRLATGARRLLRAWRWPGGTRTGA